MGYFSSYPLLLRKRRAAIFRRERPVRRRAMHVAITNCDMRGAFGDGAMAGLLCSGGVRLVCKAVAPVTLALLSLARRTQGWPTALCWSPVPGGRESVRLFAIGVIFDPLLVGSFSNFSQQVLSKRAKRGGSKVAKWGGPERPERTELFLLEVSLQRPPIETARAARARHI